MVLENEAMNDLRADCQHLMAKKNGLESEIEMFKGQIKTLHKENRTAGKESIQTIDRLQEVENGLRSQLQEWEMRYKRLQEQNRLLLEEKCELEEAENDSRLQAQR